MFILSPFFFFFFLLLLSDSLTFFRYFVKGEICYKTMDLGELAPNDVFASKHSTGQGSHGTAFLQRRISLYSRAHSSQQSPAQRTFNPLVLQQDGN